MAYASDALSIGLARLAALIEWELTAFLFGLAAIVAVQLLTGQINTSRLLHGRVKGCKYGEDLYLSPERVQLLLFTIGAGFHYLSLVLQSQHSGGLPAVPNTWLAVLGGSNTIYLGGKAYTQLGWKRRPAAHRSE